MRVYDAEFNLIYSSQDLTIPECYTEIRHTLIEFGQKTALGSQYQADFVDSLNHMVAQSNQVWAGEMYSPYEYSDLYYVPE